jgi:hypothetical protein
MPVRRHQVAKVPGRQVIRRDADHRAIPAPKDGTLASKPAAVFDSKRLSPTVNTRNPAATHSSPLRKYFKANNAVATISPIASTPHSSCRIAACPTKVPARPNAPPVPRPIAAMRSNLLCLVVFIMAFPPPGNGCSSEANRAIKPQLLRNGAGNWELTDSDCSHAGARVRLDLNLPPVLPSAG